MSQVYDAIVVGAGLGGLSAATKLARHGKKVLLLERHNIPGGYATSFVRGRFEFEVALHELSGMGHKGQPSSNNRYLDDLGVSDQIELLWVTDIYRSVFLDSGLDITLPMGREAYTDTLCAAFPHEARGIRRFIARIFDLASEALELEKKVANGSFGLRDVVEAPVRFRNAARYLPATWGQILHRDVQDPLARAVISQYWGYFGLPPSRVSFLYFAVALANYIRFGATYVRGRSQALSNAFVKAYEGWGGEVRFNCGVQTITTAGERVTGVITEAGDVFEAPIVLANTSPVTAIQDLIGVEKVPAAYVEKLSRQTVAPSTLNVYLGLNKSHEDLGLLDHEVFVNEHTDIEAAHAATYGLDAPHNIALTCYNAVYPQISPPGTSIVVLTALLRGDPWYDLDPTDYVATKNRIATGMIDMAEKVAPGLRDVAEVVEVSTPLTNMRYAGALGGSIYGFDQPPHNSTVLRTSPKGPLGGLWFVGAWTQPGGGFEPAMISGRMAAETILAGERKSAAKREASHG